LTARFLPTTTYPDEFVLTLQILEEAEEEEGSGHFDHDLRNIYAKSTVSQASVKALIALHKNLPDEVRIGA
jgi:hypothetical protein